MTSPISPISGLSGVSGIEGIASVGGAKALNGTEALAGTNENFASLLSHGLESVQAAQQKSSDLAVKVADGTLQDPAQYTMAANEAALGLQLTLAIRNKAVEAFQEIMRMQA
jgi:flagellar hook-basal body complex protein FliE